jgi:Ser/Thr protein kinase RdoA (MazF antagonist)
MMAVAPKGFPQRDDLSFDDGVVVRRHDRVAVDTVRWIHRFLDQLAFNAPKPVAYFDGASVVVFEGVVWSALSYVEGETVGWSPKPTMFELGAFLATFHEAAAAVEMDAQQSPVFPVEAGAVAGHADRPRHVIHGDPTNHNVLAVGSPWKPCGIIDFGNAFIEVPLFDIGCALWRGGRPSQEAHEFDPHRIAAYVDGYSSVLSLSHDDRAAVVAYLGARGEQIIAKQASRGVRDDGPRRKLDWLRRHGDDLAAALSR